MKKYVLLAGSVILIVIALVLFVPAAFNRNGGEQATVASVMEFSSADVRNISVLLSKSSLSIGVGETDKLTVSANGAVVAADLKEGGLTVEERETRGRDASVVILLPAGAEPESVTAALGVGSLTVTDLSCSSIDTSSNVGDVVMKLAAKPDSMKLSVGTGDVSITFPGTEPIEITAPFGLGNRDYAERFRVTDTAAIVIDVAVGNTVLR